MVKYAVIVLHDCNVQYFHVIATMKKVIKD